MTTKMMFRCWKCYVFLFWDSMAVLAVALSGRTMLAEHHKRKHDD